MRRLLVITLLVFIGWLGLSVLNAAPGAGRLVRIGLLEANGSPSAQDLTATADYLNRRLPRYTFTFISMSRQEIREAIDTGHLEFVLLDAGSFVDLSYQYDVRPVATRRAVQHERPYARFGAVIVARSDRIDIARLSDLKGKSFMAPQTAFGSFQLASREFQDYAVRPLQDFSRLVIDSTQAEHVLDALQGGRVDGGAVPTGLLETLDAQGRIDQRDFRVLNAFPPTPDFPLLRSTPLYPDWPLVATGLASAGLVQAVANALYAMGPDDPAARAGGYAGWAPPLSYEPVFELYRELHMGPYRQPPLQVLARDNLLVLLLGALMLVALLGVTVYALRVNRRLAEAVRRHTRMQEQMQIFASAVGQTADAVMITDPHGVIEYVNPAFTRITGYTPDEVRGRPPAFLKSGQHDGAFYKRLWDTILGGNVFRDELINRRKDGALFWEQKSIMPLRDGAGRIAHFVATGRDITEQRRTEEEVQLRREQLAHTARVNIIGEMASSLAHEISQPLTAIINYAQGSTRRLRMGEMDNARLLGVLEQIVAQAQRVADAVLALRRFVARRKPQRVQTDINALVTEVVALATGETRKRGIGITLDLGKDLPPASVDDVQIEQVILNLLRNGTEALASADAAARELKVSTGLAEDGAIEISISDTGPGLPPRLAAKLFEPFFTTKPDGVGLGLAVSRTIIETHGGHIWVTPNPERGVTFRFTVPVETQTHER